MQKFAHRIRDTPDEKRKLRRKALYQRHYQYSRENPPLSRLHFEDEESPGMSSRERAVLDSDLSLVLRQFQSRRGKLYAISRRLSRTEAGNGKPISWRKRRYYRGREKPGRVTLPEKARQILRQVSPRGSEMAGLTAVLPVFLVLALSLSSCSVLLQGTASSVTGTAYVSPREEILVVENYYRELEDSLNTRIQQLESLCPEVDEFLYQVDEIYHNPYHLISYLTAKYGEFTLRQVRAELEEIFAQQYRVETETLRQEETVTRTVQPGEYLGRVVTTGYCNCVICCGPWAGGPTATGGYPVAGRTVAVDASRPYVPLGTRVILGGRGYVAEDTGIFGPSVQFDIYYDSHGAATAHGRRMMDAYLAWDNGRPVELTERKLVTRMRVRVRNQGLDAVLRSRLLPEELSRYSLYNLTLGHQNTLFDNAASESSFYQVPPEALSDQRFAAMIREAEKFLGSPYVWGGSSPSTGFDCSGFVCWVIDNCGNGWNVGRRTADGLRGFCTPVSPSDARPGDLIFFQGTYPTPGASHVGIYVGNQMMIHCGNPISYTSIATAYWQQHFLAFGRLP